MVLCWQVGELLTRSGKPRAYLDEDTMEYSDRLGEPLPHSIAIMRALHLGDMLCAVPAFRALRTAFPEAQITLVGLPWARSFVKRFNHCLDDFLEFPGYPGIPERTTLLRRFPEFLLQGDQSHG